MIRRRAEQADSPINYSIESSSSSDECDTESISSCGGDSFRSDESYYDEVEDFNTACLNNQQHNDKKLNFIADEEKNFD